MADPLERLIHALEHSVENAIKQKDTDSVAAQVLSTIQLRTARGEFLDGSGGIEALSYKSEPHKKKRAKLGLRIDRVNLFMGGVGVLEALRARSVFSAGEVTIEAGFIDGLSEERAAEIGGYLTQEGAGVNKVTYPFVGVSDNEEDQIVKALADRIGTNFQQQFNF